MRLAQSAGDLLRSVEAAHLKKKLPAFGPGDTVRLTLRVPEGAKERVQMFEGLVIARRGGGSREMVTVRKISFGIGVERTIPLHSPFLTRITVLSSGKVRRAKLYYMRDLTGKASRLKREYTEGGGVEEAMEADAVAEAPAAGAEVATPAEAAPVKAEKKPEKKADAGKKAK
jgi:large subunit ribosomal protein L19